MSYAALAVGVVSIGSKIYMDARAKKKAKDALKKTPVVDDAAVLKAQEEKKANWQNAYNTGMLPGQAIRQQQIMNASSNVGSALSRNLASGSQRAMAVGQQQGQLDASMQDYWGQVGQTKMGLLGGLSGSIDTLGGEHLRRYQDNQATRAGLQQTMYDSDQNIGNSLMNVGGMATGYGLNRLEDKAQAKLYDSYRTKWAGVNGGNNAASDTGGTVPSMAVPTATPQQEQVPQPPVGVAGSLNFFNNQQGGYYRSQPKLKWVNGRWIYQ